MSLCSRLENAIPLIITHGWPGSPIEQLKIINPLTNTTAHGGNASGELFVDGEPYGELTRDDILDNITLAWLTNTGVSSARLYVEYNGAFFTDYDISVPAAVSVFPEEVYQAPRSWTERAYKKLLHSNQLDKGGHFAAWEQPELFVNELRAGFKSLR